MRNVRVLCVDYANDTYIAFDVEDSLRIVKGSSKEATIGKFVLQEMDTEGEIDLKLEVIEWEDRL